MRHDLNLGSIEEAARKSSLRWFGHVQRRNDSRLRKKLLNASIDGIKGRGIVRGYTIGKSHQMPQSINGL